MEVIADTTVLIDIWRHRRAPARLADLERVAAGASLSVPWITRAEFSRGALFKGVSADDLAAFYRGFQLLPLDEATIDAYCGLWVEMARTGKAPDYPDLWIAACAVSRGAPLLTRNPKHFGAIPGLRVCGYRLEDPA